MDWTKTTARQDRKHLSFGIGATCIRGLTVICLCLISFHSIADYDSVGVTIFIGNGSMESAILHKYFTIITDEKQHWIDMYELVKYLQDHKSSSDLITPQRTDNMKRYFKKNPGGNKVIKNKVCVPVRNVLRYIYAHAWELKSCGEIADAIENQIVGTGMYNNDQDNHLDLYKDIAKGHIKYRKQWDDILYDLPILDPIPSLYEIHRSEFTEREWKKICLFEHHFGLQCHTPCDDLATVLKEKRLFHKKCLDSQSVAKEVMRQSVKLIPRRMERLALAEEEPGLELCGDTFKHLPDVIETELLQGLRILHEEGFSSVICVDSEESKINNGIHVFVEMNDDSLSQDVFHHVVRTCEQQLLAKHKLGCLTVAIFSPGTFESYKTQTPPARCTFRDDFQCGRLPTKPLYTCTSAYATEPHSPESQSPKIRCSTCYQDVPKPLDFKSFDAMQEWHMDVPLPVQIILEGFMNRRTVVKNGPHNCVKKKTEKLYTVYDTLLKIYNKKYRGLMCQANNNELIRNDRSVSPESDISNASDPPQDDQTTPCKPQKRLNKDSTLEENHKRKRPATSAPEK